MSQGIPWYVWTLMFANAKESGEMKWAIPWYLQALIYIGLACCVVAIILLIVAWKVDEKWGLEKGDSLAKAALIMTIIGGVLVLGVGLVCMVICAQTV